MPAARYMELSEAQQQSLRERYRTTHEANVRTRCQMLLLSALGHGVDEIARLTFFDENTVLYWFDRYAHDGVDGLEDRPRSGRPHKAGPKLLF